MLELDGLGALVVLGLWIFCLIDVITTDESLMRNLGKTMWLVLVLFLPAIGSIAWLVAGRPQATKSMPYKGNAGSAFPEYERPGRAVAANPEDDEAFLRGLRERAEEQRAVHRAKKRQELGELGETDPPTAN